MKLDAAPLNIAGMPQPESKPELKDDTEANSTNAGTVSLFGKSSSKIELPSPVVADCPDKQQSAAAVFVTTFLTIFLAEIGDKTQLSTLLMSAESHSPWVVFLGSAAALVTTSLLGVVLGSWIASRLSPKVVEKSAGVLLLLISLLIFWDLVRN
ncbi:MAG: TMEM165/GDT1 family protein [Stigonema ocellatum SAG 48.90 = DSM 106950]|nr:TMEM165/GDT1 family protein [Stigonema ocellatum SAG 48.90 = DSM 106950]